MPDTIQIANGVESKSPSSSANADFVYREALEERKLRLLRIHSNSGATLECYLESKSLEEASRAGYYALSYCWGDGDFSERIKIDGKQFAVKANALHALRAVYEWFITSSISQHHQCRVWIDAICINQNNNIEKSTHIKNMAQIYSKAARTLIWLGVAENGSDRVCAVLSQTSELLHRSELGHVNRIGSSLKRLVDPSLRARRKELAKELESRYHLQQPQVAAFAELIENLRLRTEFDQDYFQKLLGSERVSLPFPSEDLFWQSLSLLLCRPWFSRIWTYQEGVLGSDAFVLCGDWSITWSQFREWRVLLNDWLSGAAIMGCIKTKISPTLTATYDRERIGTGFEALQNICVFDHSTRHASVNKDFVYGYLGVVGREIGKQITVDYSIPDWIVFAQTAKIIVEGSMGANSWSCMLDRFPIPSDRQVNQLPSWCPDFTCQDVAWADHYSIGTELHGRLLPDRIMQQLSVAGAAVVSGDLRTLTVPGYTVDTIVETSDVVFAPCLAVDTWEEMWDQQDPRSVSEWLLALEAMCVRAKLDYPRSVFSFFFETTDARDDGPLHQGTTKTHERPQRFNEIQRILREIVGIDELVDQVQTCKGLIETYSGESEDANVVSQLKRVMANLRFTRIFNRGRHFFATAAGRIGFSSRKVVPGQHLCYFSGSYYLKVFSFGSNNVDQYVGVATVHGLMNSDLFHICSDPASRRTFHIG